MTEQAIVCDRLGIPLEVGDTVLLLQVPVIGDHKFIFGKVLTLGKKKVKIKAVVRDRWGSSRETDVLRYPDQLIKKSY